MLKPILIIRKQPRHIITKGLSVKQNVWVLRFQTPKLPILRKTKRINKYLENYCKLRETKEIKTKCNVKSPIISWRKNQGAWTTDWTVDDNSASMFNFLNMTMIL